MKKSNSYHFYISEIYVVSIDQLILIYLYCTWIRICTRIRLKFNEIMKLDINYRRIVLSTNHNHNNMSLILPRQCVLDRSVDAVHFVLYSTTVQAVEDCTYSNSIFIPILPENTWLLNMQGINTFNLLGVILIILF